MPLGPVVADLRSAALLLTRLPVGGRPDAAIDMSRAVWAYPVVGMLIGAGGGAAFVAALGLGLPARVAAILAVAAAALATGGLHEDGLADMADGMGGGATPARKLEIMRDSRLGTYGALALIVVVLARVELVAVLAGDPGAAVLALAAIGALSRGTMIALAAALPPARTDGLGRGAGAPRPGFAVLGLVLSILPVAILAGVPAGLGAVAAAALAAAAIGLPARRQLGGHTGDVLGAGQQLGEVAALAAVVLAWPIG